MIRTILLIPDLIGKPEDESALRQNLPSLHAMADMGEIAKIAPVPPVETPEALWLGLPPSQAQMAQGPLTVAAFGFDPPERSTHFHVSLLSLKNGVVANPDLAVVEEDLRVILDRARRLDAKQLVFIAGEGRDHALVWEDVGDLATVSAQEATGRSLRDVMPEGDADRLLRRFIDDSVNLLDDLELNRRRVDEGLPPFNLLWPWGHGRRASVPNLAFRRGEVVTVVSSNLRLSGLARLAGYRHVDRAALRSGLNFDFEEAMRAGGDLSIVLLDGARELREAGKLEELHWWARELDSRYLKPLLDRALRAPSRVCILCPGPGAGLALTLDTPSANRQDIPFDERALEERALPVRDLWTMVETALTPPIAP